MDSSTLSEALAALENSQRKELLKDGNLVSIYQIFETIPDPRRPQGRRYELAYLLTCLTAAMLSKGPAGAGVWTAQILLPR
jgi:hypothetical protein